MKNECIILILEAMAVYSLVLWAHSMRSRVGLAYFYALLGGITAVMSWVTDAGVKVEVGGVIFMAGSTVFYTSLLLGVFVVYVFDGPRATRIAISTVAGVSIMVPIIALVLHVQIKLTGNAQLGYVPIPSLRINTASVLATVADLVFLAISWEFFSKRKAYLWLWLRAFLTLLGVMWLDVILFATGAFAGSPDYRNIMTGTLVSRFLISIFACPFLYLYLYWQNSKVGVNIENRPLFAILKEVGEVRAELSMAQREIERRKIAEMEKEALIKELANTLAHVRNLEDLLPVCSSCKRIRIDSAEAEIPDQWVTLEEYVGQKTPFRFSHGLCDDCMRSLYPELAEGVLARCKRPSKENDNSTPADGQGIH